MIERTEEEKLTQDGIVVILGGKEYSIAPLVLRDSRKWRKGVVGIMASIPQYASVTTDTPDEFGAALNAIMVALPDKVIDLFFGFAKDLDRKEIEGIATDVEVAKAFEQVIELAFPLASSPAKVMGKLYQ